MKLLLQLFTEASLKNRWSKPDGNATPESMRKHRSISQSITPLLTARLATHLYHARGPYFDYHVSVWYAIYHIHDQANPGRFSRISNKSRSHPDQTLPAKTTSAHQFLDIFLARSLVDRMTPNKSGTDAATIPIPVLPPVHAVSFWLWLFRAGLPTPVCIYLGTHCTRWCLPI